MGQRHLSGIVEAFNQKVKRHEYPEGEITFIMVSVMEEWILEWEVH